MKLYAGLMSGTSLDGVEGVLVDFEPAHRETHGPAERPVLQVVAHEHVPMPASLAAELRALNASGADELHRAALAANALVALQASLVDRLLRQAGVAREHVRAIGSHGQTVRHRPGEFDGRGYTLQLNQPALLAELCGIDVVADFRSRDIAAGGQGAPLVPAFHEAVFGGDGTRRAVLNLGGMANLTLLPVDDQPLRGFDCGPGNVLMDHWCQAHTGQTFDRDGGWAASGRVDASLLAELLAEPWLALPPPKSTGRDLFNASWLGRALGRSTGGAVVPPADVQATLLEFTARAAMDALRSQAPATTELLVCGGGAFNRVLMARLAALWPGLSVASTATAGLPPDQVEGAAFAWLARRFCERAPGNEPSVTGARGSRILGALYPA
jgi:anhydro-N-acetylmuramic acid kinase